MLETKTTIAREVARRYLTAGKIEAPPVMLEKAIDFFYGKAARKVYEQLDYLEMLATGPVPDYVYGPIKEIHIKGAVNKVLSALNSLRGMLGGSAEEDKWEKLLDTTQETIETSHGVLSFKQTVDGHIEARLDGGLIAKEDPDRIAPVVHRYLQNENIQAKHESPQYRSDKDEYRRKALPEEDREAALQDVKETRKLWEPHLGRDRGVSDTQEIDLTGWYYSVEDYPKGALPKSLFLSVRTHKAGYNGTFIDQWSPPEVEIWIPKDIYHPHVSRRIIQKMAGTVRHEMRHFAQYLINIKAQKEDKFEGYGGEHHNLHPIEFDTIIYDEIEDYREYIRQVPREHHPLVFRMWTNALTHQDGQRLTAYKNWIKQDRRNRRPTERVTREPLKLNEGRQLFRLLKEHDRDRWKEAVKILARNT